MSTMESVKAQIRTLIDNANVVTGNTDTDLTTAIGSLIEKANSGGGSSELVKYVTFMSWDGSIEYGKKPTISGDDCLNPVSIGLFEAPTKESTAQYDYQHSGWSATPNGVKDDNVLKNVTEDLVVYASFDSLIRSYNIHFYDDTTHLQTLVVQYGDVPMPDTPTSSDSTLIFDSWSPKLESVTGEQTYYAVWVMKANLADFTWSELASFSESGVASSMFEIGDTKELEYKISDTQTGTLTCELIAFDYDDLSDGSGKAGMTFYTHYGITGLGAPKTVVNKLWSASGSLRDTLSNSVLPVIDEDLKGNIKTVKKYSYDSPNYENQLTNDVLWCFSCGEMGFNVSGREICNGPYPRYIEKNNMNTTSTAIAYDDIKARPSVTRTTGPNSTGHYLYHTLSSGKLTDTYSSVTAGYLRFGFCI